jgi:Flp pilus assembly pilin Flp
MPVVLGTTGIRPLHEARMKGRVFRLIADDEGQDLIEYALLTTVIGLACIAVFDVIRQSIATAYGTFNASANANWQPPDPGASGS